MDVKVISNEMIKPYSPTPENLRHYNLSFLDQMSPRAYCPFIYYYSSLEPKSNVNSHHDHIADVSNSLKESLSKALTLYYPLAGRVIAGSRNLLLRCDDEGALFTEAHAGEKLAAILETPVNMFDLNKLLPVRLDEIPKLPLAVQLTAFSCGGVAIGVCIDHFVGDALSSLIFLQNWAAIARGDDTTSPEFISGEIFPANPALGDELGISSGAFKGMCVGTTTKRFVFESSKIEALRVRISGDHNSEVKPPSRVSALSAFLWTCFGRSIGLGELGHPASEYAVILAANIRSKLDPPLTNHSFGNYYALSATTGPLLASTDIDRDYRQCRTLASRLGQDLRKIDGKFVGFVRENGAEFLNSIKKEQARVLSGEVVGFFLSSLCRFPIYEADFGFGKPFWVSSAARGFQNAVTFFDKKDGDGIEAFICLKHEDMAKLEADQEFLSFVTSSPIIY